MIYEKIKKLNEAKFYRHTGIHTNKEFNKYLEYLKEFKKKKVHLGGAFNKLLMEDMLIMTLKYWKEYPTFSQMSITYNISQSSCFRNVNWVENALLENPDFKLPKILPKNEKGVSIKLIDITEIVIADSGYQGLQKIHEKNTNTNKEKQK